MKTAFITGANRGLGFGFVEHLLERGYKVFAGTRKITETLPKRENLIWVQCDVTDDASLTHAYDTVKHHTDTLDLLVNNAGVNKDTVKGPSKGSVATLGELDRTTLQKMFDINTISPIMVTKTFVSLLTSYPSFIINITSGRASFDAGHAGSTANYGYASTKVALNMMVFCSVVDLPTNVKTFAVHPGSVHTDMYEQGTMMPKDQVESIMKITDSWDDEKNGRFLNYDGNYFPL
jgi:NAD(P)-dependent dehydrogenase (short-subunit alcohol dehydrogenase family)